MIACQITRFDEHVSLVHELTHHDNISAALMYVAGHDAVGSGIVQEIKIWEDEDDDG